MPRMFDILKGDNNIMKNNEKEKSFKQPPKKIDKFKALVILVGILIFAEGSGLVYFAHKSQMLSATLVTAPEGKRLDKEGPALKDKYEELLKNYEAVKADRDNLISQAKRLLEEKRPKGTLELQDSLTALEAENQQLKAEKERALSQNQKLEGEISQFKDAQARVEAEKNRYLKDYEKIKKGTPIEETQKRIANLQNEVVALRKENKKLQEEDKKIISDLMKKISGINLTLGEVNGELNNLKAEKDKAKKEAEDSKKRIAELRKEYVEAMKGKKALKTAERDMDALNEEKKKVEIDRDELNGRLNELKKKYAEAVKKNEAFEKEVEDMPRRFSEVSRQNQSLIRETAEMHYNLGVFYAKNKEYARAIAEFQKAVEISPDDAHAYFNLGYLCAEYLADRKKAVEYFRDFLRVAKSDDKDIDWAKKYLLTWETYEGKHPME